MKLCLFGDLRESEDQSATQLIGRRHPTGDTTSSFMAMTDEELVAQFYIFFAAVDIDGNGFLSWDEFTTHIVERVMASNDQNPDRIQEYTPGEVKELSKRSMSTLKSFYHFEHNDTIVTFDVDSPEFRVYSSKRDLRLTVVRPEGFITSVDYIPKSKQYVVSSTDRKISTYDDTTGVLCRAIRTPGVQVTIKWIESCVVLYSADVTGTMRAWDGWTFNEKFKVMPVATSSLRKWSYAEKSSTLSSSIASGDEIESSNVGTDDRDTVSAFARDEAPRATDFRTVLCMLELNGLDMLATGSMDSVISIWDIETGRLKRCLCGHSKGVCTLGFSAESRFLVSGGFDFDVIVWNPHAGTFILRLPAHKNTICGVELVSNTPQLITADVSGEIKVWDVRNFSCVQHLKVNDKDKLGIRGFVSIRSKQQLLVMGRSLHTFQCKQTQYPDLTDDTPVFATLYSMSALSIMTVSMHRICVWDMQSGGLMRICCSLTGMGSELTAACLDARQHRFIVGDHEGHVRAFNCMNGEELQQFHRGDITSSIKHSNELGREPKAHNGEVSNIIYIDEYGLILTSSWDGTICVFDDVEAEDWTILRVMSGGHARDITALAFSIHLSLIASGSSNGDKAEFFFPVVLCCSLSFA